MAKIKCPRCDYNKINVGIWGSAEIAGDYQSYVGIEHVVAVNVDRHEVVFCTKCYYKGDISEFIKE